jgi:transcriptional regulator with XRE-family HTH domain
MADEIDGKHSLRRLLSLQEPGESDAAFARRIGLAPQVLSNYKNGHHGLSLRSALRVHDEVGLSLDWLLAGDGSPETSGDGDERPYAEGARYVFERRVRSMVQLIDDVAAAGVLDEEEAREMREPLEDWLDG